MCDKIVDSIRERLFSKVILAVQEFYIYNKKCEMAAFTLVRTLSLGGLFSVLSDRALLKKTLAGLRFP